MLRRLSFEAHKQGVHHTTTSITFWRVVPPRLVRCRLGASFFVIVELNQEVCTGKEIAYFVKNYP